MAINDFMNKVRQWDNRAAQWMVRHFYILFFEIILVGVFLATLWNSSKIIDAAVASHKDSIIEQLLVTQSVNTLLITMLLLFNSFWLLYIFSSMLKLRGILKNIDFNLSKRRDDRHRDREDN